MSKKIIFSVLIIIILFFNFSNIVFGLTFIDQNNKTHIISDDFFSNGLKEYVFINYTDVYNGRLFSYKF